MTRWVLAVLIVFVSLCSAAACGILAFACLIDALKEGGSGVAVGLTFTFAWAGVASIHSGEQMRRAVFGEAR